eukprot:5621296-Prymnesium_polylepis.1
MSGSRVMGWGGGAPRERRPEAEHGWRRAQRLRGRGFEGGPFDAHFFTSFSSESTSKLVFAAADGGA